MVSATADDSSVLSNLQKEMITMKNKALRPLVLAILLSACLAQSSSASILVNPTSRGSTNGVSSSQGSNSSIGNYYAQNNNSGEFRNFFVYDLSAVNNVWITSASLRLRQGPTSYLGTATATLTLRDFDPMSSNTPLGAFNDAGSGYVLGSGTFLGLSANGHTNFNLNNTGRNVVQNTILGDYTTDDFGLGGRLTSLGGGGVSAFGGTFGSAFDSQLVLEEIANSSPTANSVDKSILFGEGVQLDGSGSSDQDSIYGDFITTYMWDIDNDGSFDVSTGTSILNLFDSDLDSYGLGIGIHDVRLKVTDLWGSTNIVTSSLEITATAAAPEPTTLFVWGGLGMCLVVATRRRRRWSHN